MLKMNMFKVIWDAQKGANIVVGVDGCLELFSGHKNSLNMFQKLFECMSEIHSQELHITHNHIVNRQTSI